LKCLTEDQIPDILTANFCSPYMRNQIMEELELSSDDLDRLCTENIITTDSVRNAGEVNKTVFNDNQKAGKNTWLMRLFAITLTQIMGPDHPPIEGTGHQQYNAFALDAAGGWTAKALAGVTKNIVGFGTSFGVNWCSIVIRAIQDMLSETGIYNVTPYCLSAGEFVDWYAKTYSPLSLCFAWFDYCAADYSKFIIDIENVFKYRLIPVHGLVCYTFSLRLQRGSKKRNNRDIIMELVLECVKKHGYEVEIALDITYNTSGPMVLVALKVLSVS
jgi:hypothetical protein